MRRRFLTLDGRTQCLQDWAREYNLPVNTVQNRLKRGDDLRTALTHARKGFGYRGPKGYGITEIWNQWVTAPVLSTAFDAVK